MQKNGKDITCENCGISFYVGASRLKDNPKFCSMDCMWVARKKRDVKPLIDKTCKQCGVGFQVEEHRKDSAGFCSRKCSLAFYTTDEQRSLNAQTHGLSKTPEYGKWIAMKQRCDREPNYIKKGIQIYPPWRESFEAFLAYMGPLPEPEYTLDRYPDNLGNYEPGNVRWVIASEQQWHRRGVPMAPEVRAKVGSLGAKNGNSKLTEEIVRDIRTSVKNKTATYGELAQKYSLNYYHVRDVVKRRVWKQVE